MFLPLYQPLATLLFRISASAYRNPTGQPLFRGQLPMLKKSTPRRLTRFWKRANESLFGFAQCVCVCQRGRDAVLHTISVLILSCPVLTAWSRPELNLENAVAFFTTNNKPSAALFLFPPHFSFLFLFPFVIQHKHTLPVSGQGSNQTPLSVIH